MAGSHSDRRKAPFVLYVPGMDGTMAPRPAAGTVEAAKPAETLEAVEIGKNFKEGLGGKPSSLPGSWPSFRGPKFDISDGVLSERLETGHG